MALNKKEYERITRAVYAYLATEKRRGRSANEAAERLGMSYSTLMRRQRLPEEYRLNELISIAGAIRTPLSDLLGGEK